LYEFRKLQAGSYSNRFNFDPLSWHVIAFYVIIELLYKELFRIDYKNGLFK
jgi:hypothetical protein